MMSPEIVAALVQFGSTGLLALVLYFGLQANARLIEIQASTNASLVGVIERCMAKTIELEERLTALEDNRPLRK